LDLFVTVTPTAPRRNVNEGVPLPAHVRRGRPFVAVLIVALLAVSCDSDLSTDGKGQGKLDDLGAEDFGPAATGYRPRGPLIVDSGFRPEQAGFRFENYGPGFTDLTPVEMRRLFGDAVCATSVAANGDCSLIPPATQWMRRANRDMASGHCYGFSVSSLMLFKKQLEAQDFGGATVPELELQGNDPLQRELAYTWAFQLHDRVDSGEVKGTPNEIVDKLVSGLEPDEQESFTVAIFQRDGGGGHAVTPYAVEDRRDGTFAILVYDNNYPQITRAIIVDRNANTWAYNGSTNPSEPESTYEGDEFTFSLTLFPTTPGIGIQPCPFCAGAAGAAGGGPAYGEIYLQGNPQNHAHLLITDDQGRKYGYHGGKFVTEIPGVQSERDLFEDNYKDNDEPTYLVPEGMKVSVTVDGSNLTAPDETSVGLIQPGSSLLVSKIRMEPGEKDTITFSPDGNTISYRTDDSESPTIELGFEESGADHGFAITGVDMEGGGEITISRASAGGALHLDATNLEQKVGTFAMAMVRADEAGQQTFVHDSIELEAGEKATLEYEGWDTENEGIPLVTDRQGQIQTETLADEG
jgi:hypothetical protein